MGWGGGRVGAGRKPRQRPFGLVEGRKPDPVVTSELSTPPDDMTDEQQRFWRDYAPLALERRTLTPATVPAFRLLCELHSKKVMVGEMVDKGALGGLRVFMQLAKQVEALMARFCLAPFGKSMTPDKPKVNANPWGAFGAPMKEPK